MTQASCPFTSRIEAATALLTRQAPQVPVGEAPVFQPRPLIGCLPELKASPLEFLRSAHQLGDIVRLPLMRFTGHLVAHPDDIQRVMSHRHSSYDKQTRLFRRMQQVVGQGLLTSDGAHWRR